MEPAGTVQKSEDDLLIIDGAVLEGGGQILRISSALSCLLRKPICVKNIRAGRDRPGLKAQHLTGLEMVRDLCGGRLEGGQQNSTQIKLFPHALKSGHFSGDTKTAGSVALLLQVALPALLFSDGPCKLVLKGGTDADMAPPFDYYDLVLQPILSRMGIKFDCEVFKRGYYPRGGGEVVVRSTPLRQIENLTLTERGKIVSVSMKAFVAGVLPKKMALTMAESAQKTLEQNSRKYFGDRLPKINIDLVKESSNFAVGNGSGIFLVACSESGCRLSGSALGKRGLSPEEVGKTAALKLLAEVGHGGCADEYLQDQLIIFMSLASGTSKILSGPLTLHTRTAIHVVELMTNVRFQVHEKKASGDKAAGGDSSASQCTIECDGMGFINPSLPQQHQA